MTALMAFIAVMAAAHFNTASDTTLCAVVAQPKAFDGKVVRFRAGVLTDWHHGIVLVHSGCRQGIDLIATDAVASNQSKALDEAIGAPMDGGPNRTVMATFTGRFSFHPGPRQAAFDNPLEFSAERIEGIKVYHKP